MVQFTSLERTSRDLQDPKFKTPPSCLPIREEPNLRDVAFVRQPSPLRSCSTACSDIEAPSKTTQLTPCRSGIHIRALLSLPYDIIIVRMKTERRTSIKRTPPLSPMSTPPPAQPINLTGSAHFNPLSCFSAHGFALLLFSPLNFSLGLNRLIHETRRYITTGVTMPLHL